MAHTKMFLLQALTCILSLGSVFGNYFGLIELIQRIHKVSDSATIYFIGIDDLDELLKTNFGTPVAIFTTPPKEDHKGFYNHPVMLVVQDQGNHVKILQPLILRLRARKFVIISASSLENLGRYFAYFTEYKFTRLFGIAENMSYAYLPYADNRIQKFLRADPLPDALKDLNGFTFRTTVQKDIPRTFWYPDKNGQPQVGGPFGHIFTSFLQRHNATFKEVILNNSTMISTPAIAKAIKNNEIDISMNGYIIEEGLGNSYPVRFTKIVVMVPLNSHLEPNQYFVSPFSPSLWLVIGLALVYIIAMDIVKDILIKKTVYVWYSFSRTYLTMLNLPLDRGITKDYRFNVPVKLFAFILGNIYVIYFTSFLTVYIKVKQYETMQDLIDNNVRVMAPTYEWDVFKNVGHYPKGFENIVIAADYPTYYKERNSMRNTSFAYTIGTDRGKFLIDLQTLYVRPLFGMTRDDILTTNLVYPLPLHSPFKEILDSLILRIKETGLIVKWNTDTPAQALSAGFEMDLHNVSGLHGHYVPLTVDHLRFAWICLVAGLAIAVQVFVAEQIWQHCWGESK